jgi:poly(3-hydroxybutyrate) depolymerase
MSTQTETPTQQTTGPASSRPRRWLVAATAIAVVFALTLAAAFGQVGRISIISGWFPVFLFCATVVAALIAVVLRRDVLKEFAIGIPIGIVFAVLLLVGLHLTHTIQFDGLESLYVWLCVACLLAGLVVAGWRRADWPRRIAGVAAVLLAVVSAGSVVNRAFVTYPTLDSLVSQNTTHFIDNTQLNAIRAQVAKTGQLPSHGITVSVPIPPTDQKFTPRAAYVWVPPAWFARNHPQLPVIELLHGTPGEPSDWNVGMGADATALAFAEQHHGIAPILVMPDINGSRSGDSECVNSTKYGDVATYLAKTVPAFMRNEFNASTAPGSVAVAGLSEGGMCATTLALNNPKVFAAFGNYSGDASPTYLDDDTQQTIQVLFDGSQASYNAYNPPYLLTHGRFPGLSGWFASGAQDPGVLQAARMLAPMAANAGIDTCITTPPGAHSDEFWSQAFRDSLPWLSWKLKLTPQPQSIPAQCVAGKS